MTLHEEYERDLQRYRELAQLPVTPGRFPARLLCIFGHNMTRLPSPPGIMEGMGGPRLCTRCGYRSPGFPYPPMPLSMREQYAHGDAKRRLSHIREKLKNERRMATRSAASRTSARS
jgi:hypothetical protein